MADQYGNLTAGSPVFIWRCNAHATQQVITACMVSDRDQNWQVR